MMCGNGSVETVHPSEVFGEDWTRWGLDARKDEAPADPPSQDADHARR